MVYHDVVRLLLWRKWKNYARNRFLYANYTTTVIIAITSFFYYRSQFIFYIIHTAIVTTALVLAAKNQTLVIMMNMLTYSVPYVKLFSFSAPCVKCVWRCTSVKGMYLLDISYQKAVIKMCLKCLGIN